MHASIIKNLINTKFCPYFGQVMFTIVCLCPNVSTTPLRQWGFQQCLPFSWTTPGGKHCRHPIAVIVVVDTFKPGCSNLVEVAGVVSLEQNQLLTCYITWRQPNLVYHHINCFNVFIFEIFSCQILKNKLSPV